MTRFAVDVRRQDVDCADDVPVKHATASRASIDASAGLFSLPTHGACLGRVVLILQHDLDPDMLGLVRDVLAQPPMRPARYLLVRSVSQVDAIGHVPHVADDDPFGLALYCMIDHGARDFVQDVPFPAFLLGLEAVHPFLDALTVVRPALLPIPQRSEFRPALVPVLLTSPERSAGEHQGLLGVRYDGRVDFAHVYRQHPVSRCDWLHQTVFEHHVPSVLVGLLVEHKPGFQDPTGLPSGRDGHRDRSQAPRASQKQGAAALTDAGILPDRGSKAPAILGIPRCRVPVPLEGSRRLARPIERLLGGIPAVRV